jgi:PAS domain S-box-containing protein
VSNDSFNFPDATVSNAPGFEALDALYRFVAAIELTPSVAVHCQDRAARVRFWNSTCATVFGVPASEALGQPLADLVEHLGNGDFGRMIETIWQTGIAPPPRDWEVRLRDGTRRWMYSSHFPVLRDGVTQQVFCMEFDVSERHMLEDSLQHAGRVFHNAHNAMLVLDADHHVLALNRAFTELSGLQTGDIAGKPAPGLFEMSEARTEARNDGSSLPSQRDVWQLSSENGHWEGELAVTRRDGQTAPVWVSLTAIRDRAGAVNSYGLPMAVAVNLSAGQFIDPALLNVVDAALAGAGLPADSLELEVTEAVIMRGDAATGATIAALTGRGIHLTVDDFGTGYSSLSWLQRFPLSKLKIDRSFIEQIDSRPDEAGMIPAIIAVARSLKLKVLAEGVETNQQLRFLEKHGCDEYQGYLAAPPARVPDFKILQKTVASGRNGG